MMNESIIAQFGNTDEVTIRLQIFQRDWIYWKNEIHESQDSRN